MSFRRNAITLAAVSTLGMAAAPVAMAAPIELGAATDGKSPVCDIANNNCYFVTRTTILQRTLTGVEGKFTVPAPGRIVAWSVSLASMPTKSVASTNKSLGRSAGQMVVLRKDSSNIEFKVVSGSPVKKLDPYFGTTVQFPLARTLAVRKGDAIGFTVPTWAPALVRGLSANTAWRGSRPKNKCGTKGTDAEKQQQLLTATALSVGTTGSFNCLYSNERVAYSATFIANAVAKK